MIMHEFLNYPNVSISDAETNPTEPCKSNARTQCSEIKIPIDLLASMRSMNRLDMVAGHGTLYESQVRSGSKIISRNK